MRTLEGFVIAQRFGSEADKDSLSFRKKAAFKAAFLHLERRDENPGGFVTAQRSAKQRLPVFPLKPKVRSSGSCRKSGAFVLHKHM